MWKTPRETRETGDNKGKGWDELGDVLNRLELVILGVLLVLRVGTVEGAGGGGLSDGEVGNALGHATFVEDHAVSVAGGAKETDGGNEVRFGRSELVRDGSLHRRKSSAASELGGGDRATRLSYTARARARKQEQTEFISPSRKVTESVSLAWNRFLFFLLPLYSRVSMQRQHDPEKELENERRSVTWFGRQR